MVCYPVIIPTLNRYEHFRRCVESLARNTHADETELVIGLDYPPSPKYEEGYRKIKEYLPTITGFKKVTVFERESNYGAVRNNKELTDYVFSRYDAIISTEDDNEFAPCFLDYMNKMLEHYHDDQRVRYVGGFLHTTFYGMSTTGLLFTKEYNAWGSGNWRHKTMTYEERDLAIQRILHSTALSWKCFATYPAIFRMLLNMVSKKAVWGDVIKTNLNIVNNEYQVRPAVSLCRNWGNDGSGINCRVDDTLEHQEISQALTYDAPVSWEPFYSKDIARFTFRLTWPKSNLLFLGKQLITAFLYLRYRLNS